MSERIEAPCMPKFSDLNLRDLLPQKGRMALIRKVLDADLEAGEPWVKCQVVVGEEGIPSAYNTPQVLAPVAIEYVAQAGAVLGSLLAMKSSKEGSSAVATARQGMICSVRELQVHVPGLLVGQELEVLARLTGGDEALSLIEGQVSALGISGAQEVLMTVRCSVVHTEPVNAKAQI